MRVLFIYSGAENLGIEYLSSTLKAKGHETFLLFDPAVFSGGYVASQERLGKLLAMDEKIIEKALQIKPDIVGFSAFTGNYRWCLKIAKAIKQKLPAQVVFGGVHTTACPHEVLSHDFVDYAIIGEGEESLVELLDHIRQGSPKNRLAQVPNICIRLDGSMHINAPRSYCRELDRLPFPDKSLFYNKIPMLSRHYMIMTSRGCFFNCTYCSNSMYHGLYSNEHNHIRYRSPENVIQELRWAKGLWDIKLVKFIDDVFTCSKPWLRSFIPMYREEIGLPFFCSVHPMALSPEITDLLAEGGCWLATMGIQSGSERIRKEVFHRHGTNKQIIASAELIKKRGVKLSVDNIFGAPMETEEDLKQGLELYQKLKADRIVTFWLTYYPGTKILDYAQLNGVISEANIRDLWEGKIGFAHSTGSVSMEKIAMYLDYQMLFQLRSLVHNDSLYRLLERAFKLLSKIIPAKGWLSKFILLLTGIKNRDIMIGNLLSYAFSKKHVP